MRVGKDINLKLFSVVQVGLVLSDQTWKDIMQSHFIQQLSSFTQIAHFLIVAPNQGKEGSFKIWPKEKIVGNFEV